MKCILGHFEFYQQCQSRPRFRNCDYLVSFLGIEGTKAKFIGVYKVNGEGPKRRELLPKKYPYPRLVEGSGYYYQLEKVSGFEDFEDRIIIEWGKSTRAWDQWLTGKKVIEILPEGYVRSFPGYLDFVLKFDKLCEIVNNLDSNREWHTALSAVAGVYLIVDKEGNQYVGSAYGENGIIGRWTQYAKNRHGNNKTLKKLLHKHRSTYAENFSFSILETLPKNWTNQEVIDRENIWKDKLGSRAFGLNLN